MKLQVEMFQYDRSGVKKGNFFFIYKIYIVADIYFTRPNDQR
jgi:hypothetical protein